MRFWAVICALFLISCADNPATSGPDLAVILADKPAKNLSDYGLIKKAEVGFQATSSLHAYELINPLFTDYAAKQRYVFVPEGKKAEAQKDDIVSFPVGTVLVKNFGYAPDMRMPDEGAFLVETRLLIHNEAGWKAYPYVWNKAQTEAIYAPVGKKLNIKTTSPDGTSLDFTYAVPNANQCKTCHQTGHDIIPIGPKARNLNHQGQLQNWVNWGMLAARPQEVSVVPNAFDLTAKLDTRARAYLDINCAHCHKAEGSASNSGLWLDWNETSSVRIGVQKHPTAAGRGAGGFIYVIDPGKPENSILPFRMLSNEAGIAMPELGRSLAHLEGVDLISDWISQMPEN